MTLLRTTPLLALAGILAALPLAAQDGPRTFTARPTAATIRVEDARSRLYVLADDSMKGRQSGHRGNVMATAFIAAELRRAGLEPMGENGTFFQTIPLVVKGLNPGAALQVNGGAAALWSDWAPLPPTENVFPFGATLRLRGAPVVFGGRIGGAMLPEAESRGKVVVLLPPLAPNGQPNYRFWGAMRTNPYPAAAAVAIASLDVTPPSIREFVQEERSGLSSGTEAAETGPAGFLVSTATAERMLGAAPAGLRPGAGGRTVDGAFSFAARPAPMPSRNVIAVLRGSDPRLRDEYVVISAHNDHVGTGDPVDHDSVRAFNRVIRPQGANDPEAGPTPAQWTRIRALADSMRRAHGGARMDSVFNGADDDASGTVALLEIAEAMAATPRRPRRSILFVSHTAEEAGLYGSDHFTKNPTVPLASIVAALNMDMVGRGRAEEIQGGGPRYIQLIGSRRLSTQLGAAIDSLNAARGAERMEIDYSFDAPGHPLNRYCRSDHFNYARFGIPITYLSRGYHVDYHQVGDEAQYIDYDGLTRVASFVRDIALAVADRPERPVVDGPRQDPNAPCRQ